jgi:hypothetical protein
LPSKINKQKKTMAESAKQRLFRISIGIGAILLLFVVLARHSSSTNNSETSNQQLRFGENEQDVLSDNTSNNNGDKSTPIDSQQQQQQDVTLPAIENPELTPEEISSSRIGIDFKVCDNAITRGMDRKQLLSGLKQRYAWGTTSLQALHEMEDTLTKNMRDNAPIDRSPNPFMKYAVRGWWSNW